MRWSLGLAASQPYSFGLLFRFLVVVVVAVVFISIMATGCCCCPYIRVECMLMMLLLLLSLSKVFYIKFCLIRQWFLCVKFERNAAVAHESRTQCLCIAVCMCKRVFVCVCLGVFVCVSDSRTGDRNRRWNEEAQTLILYSIFYTAGQTHQSLLCVYTVLHASTERSSDPFVLLVLILFV